MDYALLKIAVGAIGVGSLALAWSAGWLALIFFFAGTGNGFFTAFFGDWDTKERIWHAGFQLGSAGLLVILGLFSFFPAGGMKFFLSLLLGYIFAAVVFWLSMNISEREEKTYE